MNIITVVNKIESRNNELNLILKMNWLFYLITLQWKS